MNKAQIYDGYKPLVCEMFADTNRMSLIRNGQFIGHVRANNEANNFPVRMFSPGDVIINFQAGNNFYLNLDDLAIIQESWDQMQRMRSEQKLVDKWMNAITQ